MKMSAVHQAAYERLAFGTVEHQSHGFGVWRDEPLTVSMDGALRYAEAYLKRYDSPLSTDGVLGPAWLQWICGVRKLLNGDGAEAMRTDRSTDSKSNGVLEDIFWAALKSAGYDEKDIL